MKPFVWEILLSRSHLQSSPIVLHTYCKSTGDNNPTSPKYGFYRASITKFLTPPYTWDSRLIHNKPNNYHSLVQWSLASIYFHTPVLFQFHISAPKQSNTSFSSSRLNSADTDSKLEIDLHRNSSSWLISVQEVAQIANRGNHKWAERAAKLSEFWTPIIPFRRTSDLNWHARASPNHQHITIGQPMFQENQTRSEGRQTHMAEIVPPHWKVARAPLLDPISPSIGVEAAAATATSATDT